MKTYLSMICFIVLCGCQSYNRLSGGGFYTKFSQEPKETEKIEDIIYLEIQIEESEKKQIKVLQLNDIETNDLIIMDDVESITKDTIKSTKRSEEESGIDYSQVKEKVEPLGLITLVLTLINAAGLVSALVYPINLDTLLWAIVFLSFTTLIMSVVSLVRVVKNAEKYSRKTRFILGLILFLSSITLCVSIAFLVFTKTFSLF